MEGEASSVSRKGESKQLSWLCLGSMGAENSVPQRGYSWSSKCTIAGSGKEREGRTERDLLLLAPESRHWVQKLIAVSREMPLVLR